MDEHDPQRRAAHYRLDRLAEPDPAQSPPRSDGDRQETDAHAAAPRPGVPRPTSMLSRAAFADELVRQAMARGEFDDLPLTGKPIPGLSGRDDPDWWLKAFIEREQITGVLPEALQLRKDDVVLRDRLDRLATPGEVREAVEEFNARVVEARRQLRGGPPVITPLRDVDAEVHRWQERRARRQAEAAREADEVARRAREARSRARWWRRMTRRSRRTEPSG